MPLSYATPSPVVATKAFHALVALSLCFGTTSLEAQSGTAAQSPAGLSGYETRAQLIASADAAEKEGRSSEARLLRARLKGGDFQEGDRIVVVLDTNSAITDTLQVRAGKVLQMRGMPDFSVAGTLRSELNDSLRQHLSRYLKNPGVRATPLLPIAVMGEVRSPGYYYTPADVVLRDMLMRAGGPAGNADLARIEIKRSGETIWNAQMVRLAMSSGFSIDKLHLQAGDEILVPARRGRFGITSVVTVISATTALVFALSQVAR
jgi:SLBB domain